MTARATFVLVALLLGGCGGMDAAPFDERAAGGKAGSWVGWNGRGDPCSYDWTCESELLCLARDFTVVRSGRDEALTPRLVDYRCGPRAGRGEVCAAPADCAAGLTCKWTRTAIEMGYLIDDLIVYVEVLPLPTCQSLDPS